MKLYSGITFILFVMATVTNAVTSPITEMALREYQANALHQAVRHRLLASSCHRSTGIRRVAAGSAISFADLFKHLETARKAAEKRRKREKLFSKMLQITNGYKN